MRAEEFYDGCSGLILCKIKPEDKLIFFESGDSMKTKLYRSAGKAYSRKIA
jgi:hypothetical protein